MDVEEDKLVKEDELRLMVGRRDLAFSEAVGPVGFVDESESSLDESSSGDSQDALGPASTTSRVRRTGLPLLPPLLFPDGLPGAPRGSCSLMELGMEKQQLPQISEVSPSI